MAEKQLNTVLVLRNDETSAWESSERVLKKGELGLEYREDGSVMIKAGNDADTFGDLAYVGSDVKPAQVFQVEIGENDTDDIEAINTKVGNATLSVGDIAIVKAGIVGDYASYTSYVYDGANWVATDGNYSASNVFLKNSITLAGSFTSVGNYNKGDTIDAGTSLESMLSGLLQQELYPDADDKPNASITVSGGNGEVGTTYSAPTATLKITDVGSYDYAPTATGITFEVGKVKLAEGADPDTATNSTTNSSVMAKNSTITLTATAGGTYADTSKTYTFSGKGTYTDGVVPKTNLGNPYPSAQIKSGDVTIADATATFSGWRYIFGGGTTAETVDTTSIRALTKLKKTTDGVPTTSGGKGFTFSAAKGATKVIFAYPSSWTTKTPKFEIFTMAWGATEGFEKSTVQVADATGTGGLKDYTVYTYTPATPLAADNTNYCVYFA